ncbi:MAG: hypothetical protein ACT4QA_11330 [Panacagrimonas sp.]
MNYKNGFPVVAVGSLVCLLAACGGDGNGGGDDTAPAAEISKAVDTSTNKANDLRGLVFAANGKIYASGHFDPLPANVGDPVDRMLVVARFNADGTLDTTFGGDGVVEQNVAVGGDEQSFGIVELANGDVVVSVNAGDGNGGELITASNDNTFTAPRQEGLSVFLLRFSSAGDLVESFGDGGKLEVLFGWPNTDNGEWPVPELDSIAGFSHAGFPRDTAWDLRLDKSGSEERLVVFGFGSAAQVSSGEQRVDNDRYVTRLLASTGEIDPNFNGGAAFTFNSEGTLGDNARRGSVESDGSILSAGYTNLGDGLENHIILLRLTESGALDPSFTGFGLTTPPRAGVAVFNPLVADGGAAECYATGRQSSGAYVTTGYGGATADSTTPSTLGFLPTVAQDLVTFRVANGAVDTTWGNNGAQVIQSEGRVTVSKEERGRDLVVLPDDRVVQVGRFGGISAAYVFTEDGQLDTSVDGDGIIELPHPSIIAQFFASRLSPDGKRIALTTNGDPLGARLVVLEVGD